MANYRVCLAIWLSVTFVHSFSVPKACSPHSSSILNGRLRSKASLSLATVSSNEDLKPGIATIDAANEQIMGQLDQLRQTQNFRLYSVDILASCEYMPQELFECYSETCEIYPVDEEEVCVGCVVENMIVHLVHVFLPFFLPNNPHFVWFST